MRIDAELAEQKVQLEAEAAALKEERALLERNRQSAEMLSSLSARVEVASNAAIQREERLANRLDADLHERERRCECTTQGTLRLPRAFCRAPCLYNYPVRPNTVLVDPSGKW